MSPNNIRLLGLSLMPQVSSLSNKIQQWQFQVSQFPRVESVLQILKGNEYDPTSMTDICCISYIFMISHLWKLFEPEYKKFTQLSDFLSAWICGR